jgi:hypothetical protein
MFNLLQLDFMKESVGKSYKINFKEMPIIMNDINLNSLKSKFLINSISYIRNHRFSINYFSCYFRYAKILA